MRKFKEIKVKTETWIREKPSTRCKEVHMYLWFGGLSLVLGPDNAIICELRVTLVSKLPVLCDCLVLIIGTAVHHYC